MGFHQTIIDTGFTSLWKCQESSGNLTDSIGGNTAVAGGSGATYSVAGGDTGAPLGITIPNTATFTVTDHANIDLGDLFSILAVIKKSGSSDFDMMNKGPSDTSGYQLVHVANLMRLRTSGGSSKLRQFTSDTSTALEYYMFSWNSGDAGTIFQLNATDDYTVSDNVNMTDNSSNLVIGGGSGATWTLYTLAFKKGAAVTDAQWQTIYDARNTADTVASADVAFVGGGFF